MLALGQRERGVLHAKAIEDARFQERIELLTRNHLDQAAQHVRRHRVLPGSARVEPQRKLRQPVDHIGQRRMRISNVALVVRLEKQSPRVKEAVAQARGVRHQVPDRGADGGEVVAHAEPPATLAAWRTRAYSASCASSTFTSWLAGRARSFVSMSSARSRSASRNAWSRPDRYCCGQCCGMCWYQ